MKSPFLEEDVLSDEPHLDFDPLLKRLTKESPFLEGLAENFLHPVVSGEEYDVDEFRPEDAQQFPAGNEEELEGDWSNVEYDSPTTSSPISPDLLLAVPAFTPAKRALIGKLLTPARSRAAIRWNTQNHPRKSGVDADTILAALQSYVDLSVISDAIARYNSLNSTAPIGLGSKPVDAVFVEAIHQFQMKCYRDSKQHDGFAGPSVLDSLGFWPRRGLIVSAQTNEWAKGLVRSRRSGIEAALSTSTDLTKDLTYSNWWNSFVNPSFLGWGFVRPIHIYFARKLRKAELWLLGQSRFAGSTPVELAVLLAINEKHAGGRSESGSKSIHTFGLGIDIKYTGNPHIGDYRDKPIGAKRFSEVMKRAVAKISGQTLTEEKFPEYLNKLGTETSRTTGQIYDDLVQRDQDLRRYLALTEASADLAALRIGVFKGRIQRDPRNGFLNLDRDLVIALRDHACLVWGAVDFGPGANGDIMHFDCRLDDLGRAVFCGTGGTFNDKHPCWKRSEPPCPRPTARGRGTRASEIPHSECEDEYADELDEFLEDQSVADLADESEELAEELTEELDETGELDEFENFLVETEESEEELLEAEAPPLLKNPAKSDPPGQTLYVEIKLGKDSRCVKWVEENKKKKCVQYTTFVIRPMTGIFIPENYSPQKAVDLILYLHGHKTGIPGSDALIAEYWDGKKYPFFALREAINTSRKNVILVAPTLALKSEAGDLVRRNGLDNYLNKVLEALTTYGPYKGQSPTIGNLILAAHSGGGTYMRRLATSGNQVAGKIRECWGFDSLYNSSDVGPWRLWAKDYPKTRFLYSYYRQGLPRTNSENLEKDLRGRIQKLPNIFPIPSQEKDHFKLVLPYLRERLQGTTFLNSTSVGAHEANELSGAPSENQFLQASFESVEEEVLGKDERTRVTDTLRIPNRWICAIDILIENPKWGQSTSEPKFISKSRATGVLIGPRYVLSVAHIREKQSIEIDGVKKLLDVKGYTVSAARNGDNSKGPFAKVNSKTVQFSRPYRTLRRVLVDSKMREIPVQQQDDYALLILEKDLAPSTHSKMNGVLGYWGQDPAVAVIKRLEPNEITGKEALLIGYPGDTCGKEKFSGSKSEKERKISNCWNRRYDEWASTQWRSVGTLEAEASSTTVFHTADSYEGQSGAPICLSVDKKLHLVGVHTGSDSPQRNKGVRVTRRMLREICEWINADAGYPIATIKDDTLIVQPTSGQGAGEFESLNELETEKGQGGEQGQGFSELYAENFSGEDTSETFTTAETLASESEEHKESLAGEWEARDEFDELERQADFDEAEDVELEDEVVFTDREKDEDESPLFEAFAPKVSLSDLRARIDDYFEKANAEYDLGGGVKVKARPQFRYAKAGGTEEAIVKVKGILGAQFEKQHPRAIRYAAYGRAKPSDIAAITQGLIDAGELRAIQSAHPGLSDQQSVRMLQREFKMGIDCAGYVQLAFIFAFMGNDDDTRRVRLNLGLDQRRGYEKLASLPSSHFKKVAVIDAQTGDLFVLKPRADSGDRAWHTVIVVDHTVSGTIHSLSGGRFVGNRSLRFGRRRCRSQNVDARRLVR